MGETEFWFSEAANSIVRAIRKLEALRRTYEISALPKETKTARLRSLDSKIDALRAIKLDASAYPWSEDKL